MDDLSFDPLLWTRTLIAIALVVQAAELLMIRGAFSDEGIWRWRDLRHEFGFLPGFVRSLFELVLTYRSFVLLLCVQILCALLLPFIFHPVIVLLPLIAAIATAVRWRGTFNGGSDYMTVVVLSGLFVAALFPDTPQVVYGAVCYIAVVSVISYFVAGVVKLRSKSWRSGEALPKLLGTGVYGGSAASNVSKPSLLLRQPLALIISWVIIAFECLFPLALLDVRFATVFLMLGGCFHLANARLMGLNRFFLVWVATYPGIIWIAGAP